MVTPLFRPTIEETFASFLEEKKARLTRGRYERLQEILERFRLYLEQEGYETLPEELRQRWLDREDPKTRFTQHFRSPQLPPAVPSFLLDLNYQSSILSAGTVSDATQYLHELSRWLLARELCAERSYIAMLEEIPSLREQLELAEQLSSLIFDQTRDEPPTGKVENEVRGYLEIIRIRRGGLTLLPISRPDLLPYVRVSQEASSLAKVGWWLEGRVLQTPKGWLFVDIGNALP